ncbi:hypothetical protein FRC00_006660 [Tulasnella sp. 408]|nr:hypothetical protein FRC00_006660 [Tulasnella sp. 408]
MFRNGLGQVDWPKYWSYAHRIRGVYITDEAGRAARVRVNPQALLHALAAATSQNGHDALLPKARALAFEFHHASGPSLILPLIGPTVRRITIKIPQPTEQIIQAASIAFSTLISMSGNLKVEQFDITIGDDVTSATTGGTQRTLDLNIAKFLVSQKSLQFLRIRPVDSFDSLTASIRLLPCLRTMEFTSATISHNLLLKRNIHEYSIHSAATCTRLERLQVQGASPRGQHAFSLIQPLLSCRCLVTLDLYGLGAITLNASNVETMGKAWVKLESLHFSLLGDVMPLDLLLTFAASFSPSLRYLGVPLDISEAGSLLSVTTEIPSHNLKVLYTGSPEKESDVQPLAELLAILFRPGFQVIFGIGSSKKIGIKEAAMFYKKVDDLLRLIWRVQDRTRRSLKQDFGDHVTV